MLIIFIFNLDFATVSNGLNKNTFKEVSKELSFSLLIGGLSVVLMEVCNY